MKKTMPASCAPGPSVEGIIWDVMASISAASAGSSVRNGGGADDCAASCACCRAAAMSANAAIPTQCDSQSRRVDCMIYLARSGGRLANEAWLYSTEPQPAATEDALGLPPLDCKP